MYFDCGVSFHQLKQKEVFMKELYSPDTSENKKTLFNLMLTSEQKEKLKKLAKKEGLTMTGYIVDHIRRSEIQA